MHKLHPVFFFSMLLIPSLILGQTISTDRPDQTEGASLVALSSLQFESGFVYGSFDKDGLDSQNLIAPSILVRYGLTNKFEIRLFQEFESQKNELQSKVINGFKNLQIGFKFQLFQKNNTEAAFISHLIVPLGFNLIDPAFFGSINKFAVAHRLSDRFNLGYNIGYDYEGNNSSKGTYAVALAIKITQQLNFYLEPYGEWESLKKFKNSFDTGFTYLVNNTMQFDVSYGFGINHNMQYLSTGFSLNLE
ncbi:hypothetical protein GCM10011416_08820 [Polaribacter pacificus]|uniref:MetA-pathway of phenol degradation n=1 Tax=Polaribacter pacificus TaxID=1775173 RepID=A0A917MEN6_9FLAO|nr:transporter [Polaribacter pacificus]GGG93813.1 hypothetical protein GCM10011416_08820 [Polaribacter pacificus]